MAIKKTKKKDTRLKKTAARKGTPAKKTVKKKSSKKRTTPRKNLAKKKAALKKGTVKTKALAKKTTSPKTAGPLKKRIGRKRQSSDTHPFALGEPRSRSAGQSGDLQGLSNIEGADSESVDELIEEGNAFEANVVTGVQDAEDAEGKEVRTHEVPEDDVPTEYLDKD